LLSAAADGSKAILSHERWPTNAVAVECVAGRSLFASKMFVTRRVVDNFVFASSNEHCRESLAAVTVYICQREDIRISFAETLNLRSRWRPAFLKY